jgi:hypothetical protein
LISTVGQSFDFHGQSKILAIFSASVLAIAGAIVCQAGARRHEAIARRRRTSCAGGVCCGKRRPVLSLYA